MRTLAIAVGIAAAAASRQALAVARRADPVGGVGVVAGLALFHALAENDADEGVRAGTVLEAPECLRALRGFLVVPAHRLLRALVDALALHVEFAILRAEGHAALRVVMLVLAVATRLGTRPTATAVPGGAFFVALKALGRVDAFGARTNPTQIVVQGTRCLAPLAVHFVRNTVAVTKADEVLSDTARCRAIRALDRILVLEPIARVYRSAAASLRTLRAARDATYYVNSPQTVACSLQVQSGPAYREAGLASCRVDM